MGLRDFMRRGSGDQSAPPPKTIMAAALPLSGPSVNRLAKMRTSLGTEAWQKDAWYFYDAVGELKAPTNRLALALSQAIPYAAVADPDTGEPAGRSEDPRAMAAARMVLGGAKARAQLLFLYAVMWQITGDAYLVIRPSMAAGKSDEWLVLSASRITERGGRWTYTDPSTAEMINLTPGRDMLIRVWSPHPEDQSKADSAVRSALPVLSEIEKTSQNIAARLDSRLASNGLLFLPEEADFPQGDHTTAADAWSAYLMDLMERSIASPGTASAQVPIIGVLPSEMIASILHVDLATEFDSGIVELRNEDLSRLAASLDMPKSVAEGTEADSNHWTAWQVDETTYTVYIRPLLERFGDAITEHWFRQALILMGMSPEEAELTILAWDTTGIVQRPDQSEDMKWLHEQVLISDEVMRNALGVSEDDAPDEDEYRRRTLTKLVSVAPTLLSDPNVAEGMDLFEIAPEAAGVTAPAAPAAGSTPEGSPRELPATRDEVPAGLTAAAEVLVKQALDRAGGRLLTASNRGQFKDVPRHELYQHIRPGDLTGLVEVKFASGVAEAFGLRRAAVSGGVSAYVERLLRTGEAYDRAELEWFLR